VWNRLALPEFDNTLLALMGISAGAYLGFKFPGEPRGQVSARPVRPQSELTERLARRAALPGHPRPPFAASLTTCGARVTFDTLSA
jgi:hypothetical protein